MEEIWKDIDGYDGYYVSNLGNVKSTVRNKNGKIFSPGKDRDGYLHVMLSKNAKKKNYFIHRLVCSAFIYNPDNKEQVNHINGIRSDNRAVNLEWSTVSENIRHSYAVLGKQSNRPWLGKLGKDHSSSKKINQYTVDGVLVKEWDCIRDATRNLGINRCYIGLCCHNKAKSAGGFIWKFAS